MRGHQDRRVVGDPAIPDSNHRGVPILHSSACRTNPCPRSGVGRYRATWEKGYRRWGVEPRLAPFVRQAELCIAPNSENARIRRDVPIRWRGWWLVWLTSCGPVRGRCQPRAGRQVDPDLADQPWPGPGRRLGAAHSGRGADEHRRAEFRAGQGRHRQPCRKRIWPRRPAGCEFGVRTKGLPSGSRLV